MESILPAARDQGEAPLLVVCDAISDQMCIRDRRAIAQELNLTQREVKPRYEAACNVVRTRFLRYCTEKVEF